MGRWALVCFAAGWRAPGGVCVEGMGRGGGCSEMSLLTYVCSAVCAARLGETLGGDGSCHAGLCGEPRGNTLRRVAGQAVGGRRVMCLQVSSVRGMVRCAGRAG